MWSSWRIWERKRATSHIQQALFQTEAELPQHQQVEVESSPRMDVGETADFLFTPTEPGTYELRIGYAPQFGWTTTWEVAPSSASN